MREFNSHRRAGPGIRRGEPLPRFDPTIILTLIRPRQPNLKGQWPSAPACLLGRVITESSWLVEQSRAKCPNREYAKPDKQTVKCKEKPKSKRTLFALKPTNRRTPAASAVWDTASLKCSEKYPNLYTNNDREN